MHGVLRWTAAFVTLGLAAVASFKMGQLTAPAVRFEPAEPGAQSALDAALGNFQKAQRDAVAALSERKTFHSDETARAEAYRGVFYASIGAIRMSALSDHAHPRFVPLAGLDSKAGMDNPDNNYLATLIDARQSYIIRGERGSTQGLVFSMIRGQPGVADAGPGELIDQLDARDMSIDEDGGYEVIVSKMRPPHAENWLKLEDGAEMLFARLTFADWAHERAGLISIEPLWDDSAGQAAARPSLTPQFMAERIDLAAQSLFDRTSTWAGYADKIFALAPENAMGPVRPTQGGMKGQYSSFGRFKLKDGEALIIERPPSDAAYQGVQLGNRWFVSLDFETRQTSLNHHQAVVDGDGAHRFVIANEDPGVHNWLDAEGRSEGMIMMRWQWGSEKPARPTAKIVLIDELATHLPAQTPFVTAKERSEALSARRRAVQGRFQ